MNIFYHYFEHPGEYSSYEVFFRHSYIFTQYLEQQMVRETFGGVRCMFVGPDPDLAVFSKVQVVFIETITFLAAEENCSFHTNG